jgi:uncharacterized protein (DUF952 family)
MSQTSDRQNYIYHITTPDEWMASVAGGQHRAPSLDDEGFIHCSTRKQLERSLNRFFQGVNRVTLLTIDPVLLESELNYEPADNDSFPHIYGPINIGAVVSVEEVRPEEDGKWKIEVSE